MNQWTQLSLTRREQANTALRQENTRLRSQVRTYARVIHELRTEEASYGPRPLHIVPNHPPD